MKRFSLANYMMIAAAVVVISASLLISVNAIKRPEVFAAATRQQEQQGVRQASGADKAIDARALKDRARDKGAVVDAQPAKGSKQFADLKELSDNSSAIIIGLPQENVSQLTPDGKSLNLNYKVLVEYVYKGKVKKGDIINVSLPGGKIVFDDGTSAEVQTPWFRKMQGGHAYALFLTPSLTAGTYNTTGEAQGLFEIPTTKENSIVKPGINGGPTITGPLAPAAKSGAPKYAAMDVKTFLTELRQATGKKLGK
ncbi:MAG: hypothetical protein QOF02_3898 [Blastocatellia bacterium]|jgi:hypothetical protein|nr:hypothetical protein [Blastocatellia bacterium]